MDRAGATSRAAKRRPALADGSSQANVPKGTSSQQPKSRRRAGSTNSNSSNIPHHSSFAANGALTVRNASAKPENKRLSVVSNDECSGSKRNSQISTTSTQASAKGRKRKTHIGPWTLGSDVGKGGTGKVRKVRHVLTNEVAAAKIISKKVAERARAESLISLVESTKKANLPNGAVLMPFGVEREVVIMKLLDHPNIVKLYDIWENRNELYLIMEYIDGGELFDYIDNCGCLQEDETVWVFRQLLAALLHCHRLGIHHRDLKPENILLDNSETPQVKLVDFGMAALQPQGKLLTTPCGSIHYAAPEVFEKSYDGSKVDVWSLGIILYVMLCGGTPFEYDPVTMKDDVSRWYNLIKAGKFNIPDTVSPDAQDLLRRMIVPDSRKRITLENCWKHPFVQRYNKIWSRTEEEMKLENWIGERPTITNWRIKHIDQVDREILWNLRMLWHSVREEDLLKKLLNKEANQEKYFYHALEKFREEQLENYAGATDSVGYSASDYHHLKPIGRSELLPIPPSAYSRTKSQFSILDDSVQDRSESSYDPYRASRDPVLGGTGTGYSVTVHRGQSSHGSKRSGGNQLSLREELLKKQQQQQLRNTSFTSTRSSMSRLRNNRPATRSSNSRVSLVSSNFASSPPVGALARPASRHRRPVQFSHTRRSSKASTQASLLIEGASAQSRPASKSTTSPAFHTWSASPSPSLDPGVRSRKETSKETSKGLTPRQLDHETRKMSAELEQYIDGVFYHSSDQASEKTINSTTSKSHTIETPLTSFSKSNASNASADRPLPQLPIKETPNTYLAKELLETRQRLIDRYAHDESAQTATYYEVLAQLDSLLQAPIDRRTVSAPEGAPGSMFEEHRRRASEPKKSVAPSTATIRTVEPSSPPVAPLNIAKSGSATLPDAYKADARLSPRIPNALVSLDTISEEATQTSLSKDERAPSRVRQWFARKKTSPISDGEKRRASWEEPDDRVSKPVDPSTAGNNPGLFAFLRKKRQIKSKSRMALGADDDDESIEATASLSIKNSNTPRSGRHTSQELRHGIHPVGDQRLDPKDLGVHQNWFARFFNIKPASKILCFTRGRGAARQEIVRILRQWRMYGMKDVILDRGRNLVWGALGSPNHLGIKEVDFVVELFVVLEHGKRAGLSLARFTQRKGAASSFKRILEGMESQLSSRGLLVTDEQRRRDMESIMSW